MQNVAILDSQLVAQLTGAQTPALGSTRGLVERLFVSRVDGTSQPYALYVPTPLPADLSVVLLLHGRLQSEAALLGGPYFRKLAQNTGSILVAPYGRDLYDFAEPAGTEAYQILDEVVDAFHVGGASRFSCRLLHGWFFSLQNRSYSCRPLGRRDVYFRSNSKQWDVGC
ncbi:MAG: hypothetical protein M3Z14_00650 [Candidatus Eremiobacteraeota bacterium]|nr:hypothetical protein [Candidatus Eremiobacteraeota bacterium]